MENASLYPPGFFRCQDLTRPSLQPDNGSVAACRNRSIAGASVANAQQITEIPGVILGYDGGRGIILVKHASSPSLSSTLDNYIRSPKKGKHWFAFFRWNAIEPRHQIEIEARYQQERKEKREKGQSRGLGRVLCGIPATCVLVKSPTWEATHLLLDLEADRFEIPVKCLRMPAQSQPHDDTPNRFTERLRGIPSSGKTNLHQPWRG